MKYVIINNQSLATHTENTTGDKVMVREVGDDANISGPGLVVTNLDGYTEIPKPPVGPVRPTPAISHVRIPAVIENWKAKAILATQGMLDAVEAAILALEEPQRTIVIYAWNGNAPLSRKGSTVKAIAAAINLTDAQIDSMFLEAAGLTV